MNSLFCLIAGYLIGGIPFGILIARLVRGIDPRTVGSGGMGATNVSRALGKKWGIFVLLLDASKGYFPVVFLAPLLMPENSALGGMLLAVSAMAGHVWTPYAGFRGGKGVATAAGAMGAINPISLFFALGIWLITVVIFRFVSLASVMAAIVFPVIAWRIEGELTPIVYGGAMIALFLIYTHRHNFKRIFAGTESKLF
ncbi:glycerol-3-phosphate 1-O-acyltransferase PlsY [bacterium]|nr:glycerol-3-phosphate 1-O-acyltransferase PlsY [bacterium]